MPAYLGANIMSHTSTLLAVVLMSVYILLGKALGAGLKP